LNANLLFTWKRAAGAASASAVDTTSAVVVARPDAPPAPGSSPEFMPIGIVAREQGGVPAEIDGDLPLAMGSGFSNRGSVPRPGMDERPGVIEIDLIDGVRLRVDAFVNERALRRVLAVLKAAS
jgi:transposase